MSLADRLLEAIFLLADLTDWSVRLFLGLLWLHGVWCILNNALGKVDMFVALLISSLLILVGRLYVPGHSLSWAGTYEAFTHIWVGIVGTLTVVYWGSNLAWGCLISLSILTAFETFMFIAGVKTGKFSLWKAE